MQVYDVIIIGAGPAGLSAAIYAGRARLKTLLIEKGKDGGQIILTSEIENYPGSLEKESGRSLIQRMTEQVASFGVERAADTITEVDLSNDVKALKGKKKSIKVVRLLLLLEPFRAQSVARTKKNSWGRDYPIARRAMRPFLKTWRFL